MLVRQFNAEHGAWQHRQNRSFEFYVFSHALNSCRALTSRCGILFRGSRTSQIFCLVAVGIATTASTTTTTATAVAATTTTAAWRAIFARPGLINGQGASIDVLPMKGLNGGFGAF